MHNTLDDIPNIKSASTLNNKSVEEQKDVSESQNNKDSNSGRSLTLIFILEFIESKNQDKNESKSLKDKSPKSDKNLSVGLICSL